MLSVRFVLLSYLWDSGEVELHGALVYARGSTQLGFKLPLNPGLTLRLYSYACSYKAARVAIKLALGVSDG